MEYNTIPSELLSLGIHGKERDSVCGKWISSFIAWGEAIQDLECYSAFLSTGIKPFLVCCYWYFVATWLQGCGFQGSLGHAGPDGHRN